MKYAKGISKWSVFFKDKFYPTFEEAKKAQGSDLCVFITFSGSWEFFVQFFFHIANAFLEIIFFSMETFWEPILEVETI